MSATMMGVGPYDGRPGSGEWMPPRWCEQPVPRPGRGEVLLDVRAAALNRGDLLQMRGLYPPPPGVTGIPGLEAAGVVVELGDGVEDVRVGDEVVALLAGGGQAEKVAVPAGQIFARPPELSWAEAGGLAEVSLTAWTNLVVEGGLARGDTVLITAAASGVGTYATMLAADLGARVLVAGRKLERLERLRELGAEDVVLLGEDVGRSVRERVPDGVDLVVDLVGGPGVASLLPALRDRGRLVLVGLLGGSEATLPLGEILRRMLELRGSVLRPRSEAEKRGLIHSLLQHAEPRWHRRELVPVIDRVMPISEVAEAYRVMAEEEILGKIVLLRDGRDGG